jgi:hypothetical protein
MNYVETDCRNPMSQKEMKEWNLEFDDSLLTLTGRQLPPEKIIQSNPNYAVFSLMFIVTIIVLNQRKVRGSRRLVV